MSYTSNVTDSNQAGFKHSFSFLQRPLLTQVNVKMADKTVLSEVGTLSAAARSSAAILSRLGALPV